MDRKANVAFYSDTTLTPAQIFVSSPNIAPPVANTFVQMLTAQTQRLPKQPGMQAGMTTAAPVSDESSGVRTYGMPDPDEDTSMSDETDYEPNN
jgi:hypothetical protein